MAKTDSSSIKKIILKLLFVIIGGFLGTMSRYGITNAIKKDSRTEFMLGTWVSNILGCLIGGLLMPFSDSQGFVEYLLAFFSVGFCGSLTTFGGYTYDMMLKFEDPKYAGLGVGEFFAMVASCMFFATSGYFISNKLIKPHLPLPKSNKNAETPIQGQNDQQEPDTNSSNHSANNNDEGGNVENRSIEMEQIE